MKRIVTTIFLSIVCLIATYATEGDIIEIIYSGSTATVIKPETADISVTTNGAHVVVTAFTSTEEYVYKLSGSSDAGSFTLSGSYKLTLELAGLTLINSMGAAINIQCGKRCAVILDDGTVNTIADGIGGSQKAAMYFNGHPEFEGGGTLNVLGNSKHAICAKEYLQIKKTTGTINIIGAISDGIHCGRGRVGEFEKNYFQMSGGILNIENVGSDAIDSDDYGRMNIKGGVINATVNVDEGTGLKCDSIFNMTGGTLNLTVNGRDAEAIRANYAAYLLGGEIKVNIAGDGSKGIKCKNKVIGESTGPVYDGGVITIDGTYGVFYIHANNFFDDATGEETMVRAISADKDLIHSNGDIEIYAYGSLSNQFHSDTQVVNNGGSLSINQAPWKFYYADFQYDMTAYIGLELDDVLVDDLSGYAIGAFIGDRCVGVAVGDYLRIYSNTTTASKVTFKVYDLINERSVTVLSASRDVTFANGTAASTADDPILLNCRATILGDVNGDGEVTIVDVVALVNVILGNAADIYNAADVNSDEKVTIVDVMALVNLIIGK